jgi:hypothetical protein
MGFYIQGRNKHNRNYRTMLKSWEAYTSDTVLGRPRPAVCSAPSVRPRQDAFLTITPAGSKYYSASQTCLRVLLFFNNDTALGPARGKYQNAEMSVVRHRAEGRKNEVWARDPHHVTMTERGKHQSGHLTGVHVFSCAPLEVPLVCIRGC